VKPFVLLIAKDKWTFLARKEEEEETNGLISIGSEKYEKIALPSDQL